MGSISSRIYRGIRWLLIGAAAVATVGTGSLAVAGWSDNGRQHAAYEPIAAVRPLAERAPAGPAIDRNRAVEAARHEIPDATVLSAELDDEKGTQVWEVDLRDARGAEFEVTVDATSGAVLSAMRDDD